MPKNKVIFRRIRGRIVPIKTDIPETSKKLLGGAIATAGVATAVESGKAASKSVIASARFENAARKLLAREVVPAARASKLFAVSSRLASRRYLLAGAGSLIGAGLVAAGLKLAGDKSTKKKQSTDTSTAIGKGFLIAAPLAGAAYYYGLNPSKVTPLKNLKAAFELARKHRFMQALLKGI